MKIWFAVAAMIVQPVALADDDPCWDEHAYKRAPSNKAGKACAKAAKHYAELRIDTVPAEGRAR